MNIKWLFVVAVGGIFAGIASSIFYNDSNPELKPLSFSYNPYAAGVYAPGIVESYQQNGSDINIFPEVAATITGVFVKAGQVVVKDAPLFKLDDSVQQAMVSASRAQIDLQRATLTNAEAQLKKIHRAYQLNVQSVSKDSLDNAKNAVMIAQQNLAVAEKKYQSDLALLEKYMIKAPASGEVVRVTATVGAYASQQGSFDIYSHKFIPPIQMTSAASYLAVRCFLNEILVPRLENDYQLEATLFVRGKNNVSIPLEFTGIQPYVQSTIQLSSVTNLRIDNRALPILFRFSVPKGSVIYAGQYVDVYIKTKT